MKAKLFAGVVSLTIGVMCLYFVTTSSSILIPLKNYNKLSTYHSLKVDDTLPTLDSSPDTFQAKSPKIELKVDSKSPKIELKVDSTSDTLQATQLPKSGSTSNIWFSTFFFILVPTRPNGTDSRQLVRDTWFEGFQNSHDVALRFAMGNRTLSPDKKLEYIKENETYGDIIFIDAPEGTDALTNKTLSLFIWAYRHVNYKYLMKCDDDTYVFITPLLAELKKRPTTENFYYGRIAPTNIPIRGKVKWADNDWDLGPYYIPFALGGGYIISHDLVALLSEQSPHLKWHVNEDTAVGAWLSAFDIERRTDDRFCYWWKHWFVIGCKCYKSHCSKWPVLVFLFHAHSFNDLKRHFTHLHEQVSSNITITVPLTKETFV